MGLLDGRVAIVTGSGRGIGREFALCMAREGARIVVNDVGAALDGSDTGETPAEQVVGEIQALGSDYIRTARAKGLSRLSILLKHALRNAAIPVVAIAAVQLGFMLGGSIVIEQVFALHGVGFLAWESIQKNDFPVVQSVVLVLAVIYVALTMLSDLLNAVLDPRLRGA